MGAATQDQRAVRSLPYAPANDRAEWLAGRRKGIGGSDVGAILGVDPYTTAEELWLEKTGQQIPPDVMSPDAMRGTRLESIALEQAAPWFRERGMVVAPFNRSSDYVRLVHPDYPWMLGTVDATAHAASIVGDEESCEPEPLGIIEAKCPSLGMYSKIKREGLPERFILQMQHYLAVSGLPMGWWVIFCADRWEVLVFPVERDELLIERIIAAERDFWMLVETMQPPPPVVREIADLPKEYTVGTVTKRSDDDFVAALANLHEAKDLKKVAEDLEKQAKEKIIEVVGDKTGCYEGSGGRIYYSQRGGRLTLDIKALAGTNPIPLKDAADTVMHLLHESAGSLVLVNRQSVEEALDQHVIELDAFKKEGKGYRELRAYFFGEANG